MQLSRFKYQVGSYTVDTVVLHLLAVRVAAESKHPQMFPAQTTPQPTPPPSTPSDPPPRATPEQHQSRQSRP